MNGKFFDAVIWKPPVKQVFDKAVLEKKFYQVYVVKIYVVKFRNILFLAYFQALGAWSLQLY